MRRTFWLVLLAAGTAIATLEILAGPFYPSPRSICSLIEERNRINDRWATPHKGAVIAVAGTLHGGPRGSYALECRCGSVRPLVEVAAPPPAALQSGAVWRTLENDAVMTVDKSVAVRMLARVDSEQQGC